jgi:hypothetical protein
MPSHYTGQCAGPVHDREATDGAALHELGALLAGGLVIDGDRRSMHAIGNESLRIRSLKVTRAHDALQSVTLYDQQVMNTMPSRVISRRSNEGLGPDDDRSARHEVDDAFGESHALLLSNQRASARCIKIAAKHAV